jgi:hypothetical protein
MRRPPLRRLLAGALLVAAALLSSVRAQAPAPTESIVKAAFLYKFASFVEWPPGVFQRADQPLVIAVSGDEAMAADLSQLVAGRTVDGHPVIVRHAAEGAAITGAHIAFLGDRREQRLRETVEALQGPVLVVTEQAAGLRAGAVINFTSDAGRVRFSVSLASAEARNLKLSARLLAVAQSVEGRR